MTIDCNKIARYRVEVTFAGLRHCKNLPVRTMGRYKIEMSFAGLNMKSGPSGKKCGDSVNFLDPFGTGYVVSEETCWHIEFLYEISFQTLRVCLRKQSTGHR